MTVGAIFGLARATTEFGSSDGEFARFALRYRIAISTMTTKVSILTEEFIHGNGYCPIEAVSSRVKTLDSIVAKAQRLLDTLPEAADTAHRLDTTMQRLHNEVARWTAASGSDEVQWNSPPPTTSTSGGPIQDGSCEHTTHGNRSTGPPAGEWPADMSVVLPSSLKATLD